MSTPPATVPLPHTWRPLGVRLAVWFFGLLLVLICAFAWFGFDAHVRARFTWLERGTLLGLGLAFFVVGLALVRSRVDASERGLHVVNGLRSHDYEWAQVLAVNLPPGAPWATLDLADGTTMSLLGIQGSDGRRAVTAVREIRALIDR